MTDDRANHVPKAPSGMVRIPGGTFSMGSESGYAEEGPSHAVTVAAFFMDACPVTNAEYLAFCADSGHPEPASPRWPDARDTLHRWPNHPVVNINVTDAEAYAAWCGKRLPTEAEWEFAASGGGAAAYPWGDAEPQASHAAYAGRLTPVAWRDALAGSMYPRTAPVGTFPPNAYGLHDMAGNVWEWCANWFYAYPWADLDAELVGEGWGMQRVMRGGAWSSPARDLRISRRLRVHGGVGTNASGFRCVKDLAGEPRIQTAPSLTVPASPDPATFDTLILASPLPPPRAVETCLGWGPHLTEADAARIRALGFTSVEQYVHWGTIENDGEGEFDFTHWDRQVAMLERHGLKWVPFLIAGPAYSLPDWFRGTEAHRGATCLEHGLASAIQSVWDRGFDRHIDRFLTAFAEQYRHTGVIESLLLGITGDFGEAIYPVTGTAWTQVTPGPYHTHPGYWCGDPLARASFRTTMLARYDGDLELLNAAWNTSFASPGEIAMPVLEIPVGIEGFRADEPTPPGQFHAGSPQDRRRWLDFIAWYRDAMNDLARFWMQTARRIFPRTPIYLCTGGDAPPHQGADFGAQCALAAAEGGGVRITNEASDYPTNFAITRWVTSAGLSSGAYVGIEPAGGVNEFGVTARIFNAAVSGAKNLHFYAANILHSRETLDAWRANHDQIRIDIPQVDVAFLVPDTAIMLGQVPTRAVFGQVTHLRDLTDLDYVDDSMVRAGALSHYRVLILAQAKIVETATLAAIDAWVSRGGILLVLGDAGTTNVEGEIWQPISPASVVTCGLFGEDAEANQALALAIRDGLAGHGHVLIDGELDRVYVSRVREGLVILNHTDRPVTRVFDTEVGSRTHEITLPANSMTRIAITRE